MPSSERRKKEAARIRQQQHQLTLNQSTGPRTSDARAASTASSDSEGTERTASSTPRGRQIGKRKAQLRDAARNRWGEPFDANADALNIDVAAAEDEAAGLPSPIRMPPPPSLVPRRSTRLTKGVAPVRFVSTPPPAKQWPLPKPITNNCTKSHRAFGCAADSAGHHPDYYDTLDNECLDCPHCGAYLFASEDGSAKCCAQGKVDLIDKFVEYCNRPDEMTAIMFDYGAESTHFLQFAKLYNDEFSFGILRTQSESVPGGVQVVKVNGQISYALKGIHPRLDRTAPEGEFRPLNQLFTLDVADGMEQRAANVREYTGQGRKLQENVVKKLHKCLADHHQMAKLYKSAKVIYDETKAKYEAEGKEMPRFRMRFITKQRAVEAGVPGADQVHDRQCLLPTELGLQQLATVYFEDREQDPNNPMVHEKGLCLTGKTGEERTMPWWDRVADPALFPLIFSKGQTGFELSLKLNKEDGEPHTRVEDDEDCGDGFQNDPYGEGEQLLLDQEKKQRAFVSVTMFWRYMMQIRSPKGRATRNWRRRHWLWEWRGQLSELFVCTASNRIDAQKFQEAKKAQKGLRTALPKALIEALNKRAREKGAWNGVGNVFMPSENIRGSRKYYQRAYGDCMAICRKFGKPHLLITYTMSSEAEEFASLLHEGQSWNDRCDIVGRLFIDKVKELKRDIIDRQRMGPVAAWFFRVEHQNRGLPHIHMCVTLRKPDNKPADWDGDNDKEWDPMTMTSEEYIKEYIYAELPEQPSKSARGRAVELQREYCRLVRDNMYHTCKDEYCGGATGQCNKGFPKPYSLHNVVSDEAYPFYKRRPKAPSEEARQKDPELYGHRHVREASGFEMELDNAYVVPHNKFLLCKYKSHINVEWLEGDACIKYVLKYITKNNSMAFVGIGKEDGRADYDEFEAIKAARFITSNEAFLSMWGFPLVQKSHGVDVLYVHLPKEVGVVFHEGGEAEVAEREREAMEEGIEKKTALTQYFALNQSLYDDGNEDMANMYTYATIHQRFRWDKQKKEWFERVNRTRRLVRMGAVAPGNREAQALRALLLHKFGPRSFDELKDGHATFWEAAVAEGLFESDDLWKRTVDEALRTLRTTPQRVRWLAVFFANVRPLADPQKILDDQWASLAPRNATHAQNVRVWKSIEYLLRKNGIHPSEIRREDGTFESACEAIGLNRPPGYDYTPDYWVDAAYDSDDFRVGFFGDLASDVEDPVADGQGANYGTRYQDCKQKQKEFIDIVMNSVAEIKSGRKAKSQIRRLFFLTGDGGTGKTYVYNTLIAGLRQQKVCAQVTASTGIAAELLTGGGTLHSRLRIANDVDSETLPKVHADSAFAAILRKCVVLIVDEVSMQNKDVLAYVDRLLREVHKFSDPQAAALPFAGKIVILGGDWKQLQPVVPGQSDAGQFTASVKNAKFFEDFEVFRLTENMRVDPDSQEWLKTLKLIGTGVTVDDYGHVELPPSTYVKHRKELINHVFPPEALADPLNNQDLLSERAILCPKNDQTFRVNNEIMQRIPGNAKTYKSIDRPLAESLDDMLAVNAADFELENIYRKTPTGLPEHEITLKEGAIVMVIKNISVQDGICNGTRVMVTEMKDDVIMCKHIKGRRKGEVFGLYRCKFNYGGSERRTGEGEGGVRWERIQFPIRPGFVLTINKSQGQTLDKVGLMLESSQCFAHGQLYVGCGRVRKEEDIRLLTNERQEVRNVVFQMIIDKEEIEEAENLAKSMNITILRTPRTHPQAVVSQSTTPRAPQPRPIPDAVPTPLRSPQPPSQSIPPRNVAPRRNQRKTTQAGRFIFEDAGAGGDCFFRAIVRSMHGHVPDMAAFDEQQLQQEDEQQKSLRRACARLMQQRYHFADEDLREQMEYAANAPNQQDLSEECMERRRFFTGYAERMFYPAEDEFAAWANASFEGLYVAEVMQRHLFVLDEQTVASGRVTRRTLSIFSPNFCAWFVDYVDLAVLECRRFTRVDNFLLKPDVNGAISTPNPICIRREHGNHFIAVHQYPCTDRTSEGIERLDDVPRVYWTAVDDDQSLAPAPTTTQQSLATTAQTTQHAHERITLRGRRQTGPLPLSLQARISLDMQVSGEAVITPLRDRTMDVTERMEQLWQRGLRIRKKRQENLTKEARPQPRRPSSDESV